MISEFLSAIITNGNDGFPLTKAYKLGHRYYSDFIEMMNYFSNNLLNDDYRSIEKKVISASSSDEQTYLQCMCELTVLYYVMRKYGNEYFKYEPKYNGGYNPECAFGYKQKTINIEVKCPNMIKRMEVESHDTLKIFLEERIPGHEDVINDLKNIIAVNIEKSGYSGIEEIPRMDNKLKDYLEHSQKKFPLGDDYFNVLVITLEIVKDLDEWYSYLLGDNGVFTHNSFINSNYDKVDAVLLSTPVCGHRAWQNYKCINVWHLEETINLLILDPRKKHTEKGKFYFNCGMKMFGSLTKEFLIFQTELDKDRKKEKKLSSSEDAYIRFKETDLMICSEFIENLKK